jgi:hypothetical protein
MRTRKNLQSNQESLFDEHGAVPFRPDEDAKLVPGRKFVHDIEGMHVRLLPAPRNYRNALRISIDALCKLHRTQRKPWNSPGGMNPIQLDTWPHSTVILIRKTRDNGTVKATYRAGRLELSLPHPLLWSESGLGWLRSYRACCERNGNNPTPWRGKACGCDES